MSEEHVLPFHFWWNEMVKAREKPSPLAAWMQMMRWGKDDLWKRYLADQEAWMKKWCPHEHSPTSGETTRETPK